MKAPLPSSLDIYRAAKVLLDKRGHEEAWRYAEERLSLMRDIGEADGAAMWVMIQAAMRELERTTATAKSLH